MNHILRKSRVLAFLFVSPVFGFPLLNGSFELPALTTTQNISGAFTMPGWTGIASSNGGNAGLVLGPDNGLSPAEGTQHFTFNGGNPSDHGYLDQTLPTTPGTAYLLTFALGRAGGGQSLSLTLLGNTYQPPPSPGYHYHTHAFTATSPTTLLRFTDTSGPNSISDLYLDAITLTQASPVPDTTAPVLEILLTLALLLSAWRQRP
jgi:hypothetical protein